MDKLEPKIIKRPRPSTRINDLIEEYSSLITFGLLRVFILFVLVSSLFRFASQYIPSISITGPETNVWNWLIPLVVVALWYGLNLYYQSKKNKRETEADPDTKQLTKINIRKGELEVKKLERDEKREEAEKDIQLERDRLVNERMAIENANMKLQLQEKERFLLTDGAGSKPISTPRRSKTKVS